MDELDSSLKTNLDQWNRNLLFNLLQFSSFCSNMLNCKYNMVNILLITILVLSLCFRTAWRSMGEEILEDRKCWCVDLVAVQWDADPSRFHAHVLTCLHKWVIWDFYEYINNIFTRDVFPFHLNCKFLRDLQVFHIRQQAEMKVEWSNLDWVAFAETRFARGGFATTNQPYVGK